jgi:3-phosphoshikimate 1-carboxyvinyltransferase
MVHLRGRSFLPMVIQGTEDPMPLDQTIKIPSAQVKSALLLFGLHAPGRTRLYEARPTRDHSEIMLRHFGAVLSSKHDKDGGVEITLEGQKDLEGCDIDVPRDISSAVFAMAACLMVNNSSLSLPEIGLNPQRCGIIKVLEEMGALITIKNARLVNGEKIADIHLESALLKGVDVPEDNAASMIDEYPILAVLAACASGETMMRGLGELRVKESDRLLAMADGLKACGVKVSYGDDWLCVQGGPVEGGVVIDPKGDHRIAMSFLCLGLISKKPIRIVDAEIIATSFPSFVPLMCSLGAKITEEKN